MFDIYVASNISKLSVHAAITKTIRPLLSLANRTNNDYDTIMKATGLMPDVPSKRPADIIISAKQSDAPVTKSSIWM
jgi:hypothetical protein